jgi:DivIVA domain-containing protein
MPLSPDEVRGRSFGSAFRGFRRGDVLAFLERVADDYETAIAAIADARDHVPATADIDSLLQSAQESARALRQVANGSGDPAAGETSVDNPARVHLLLTRSAIVLEEAAGLLDKANSWLSRRSAELERRLEDGVVPTAPARLSRAG